MKPQFLVIGLTGGTEMRFATRHMATLCAQDCNNATDLVAQDAEDKAFCARFGLPFQPRRYYAMQATEND